MMIRIEKDKNGRLVFMIDYGHSDSRVLEVRPCFTRQLTDELTAYLFENDTTPVENDPALKKAIDMIQSVRPV